MVRSLGSMIVDPPPIPCCSIKGIRIHLHVTFFALIVIQFMSSITISKKWPKYLAFVFLMYGPILFCTILIHELGHAKACRKLGGICNDIVIWPLGGFAVCGPSYSVSGDLKVAVAGPLMHIPQMLFWFILYGFCTNFDFQYFQAMVYLDILSAGFVQFISVISVHAFFMNLFIMSFNIFVPAYPLDGGRCMAATLVLCGSSVQSSAMITSISAIFISIVLLLLGVASFFFRKDPNGIFLSFVALYIFQESYNLWKLTNDGRVREHPLFSRPCYDEREIGNNAVAETHATVVSQSAKADKDGNEQIV